LNPRALWAPPRVAERWLAALMGAALALVAARGAWYTFAEPADATRERQRRLEVGQIPRREQPLDIGPHGAYRDLLTDEELGPIVAAADPCWTKPDVGQFLHSLRLWGADATFEHAWQLPGRARLRVYTPREQIEILLEHPEFEQAFADFGIGVFLGEGDVGVTVLTNADSEALSRQGQYHVDKLLQVLAEIGAPASTHVVPAPSGVDARAHTVNDILNESLWKFSPRQEMEFTTSAYARWLSPPATWENRFGDRYHMDDLVNKLLDEVKNHPACAGMHVPYALTSALRANRVDKILSDGVAGRAEAHLRQISRTLVAVQQSDGSWGTQWNGPVERHPQDGMWYLDVPPFDQVYATGHHLEWIALAPPELGPPREVVSRAVAYLKRTVTEMPQPFFHHADVYPLGTHAVRALCLIRGVAAAEIRRRYPVVPNGVDRPSGPSHVSAIRKENGA